MEKPIMTGVILAGGQGKRMGGQDKGLVTLKGKPLYQWVLKRLKPQVDDIIISANRNQEIYQQSGYSVITDNFGHFYGPLAGILATLEYSNNEWLLFSPCDNPCIPSNLADRLWSERNNKHISYAIFNQHPQPTLCLINKSVISELHQFLTSGDRKVLLFFQKMQAQAVVFSDEHFFRNINTLDDCSKQQQT